MNKAKTESALLSISLDRAAHVSLQSQLAEQIRSLILRRAIGPGWRLPSSRSLATELSVSRITVSAVYDQLVGEGYLEGRPRSGVFVEPNLPDYVPDPSEMVSDRSFKAPRPTLPHVPFSISVPDVTRFPFEAWSKHHDSVWRRPPAELLHKPDRRGFSQLRSEIAIHLAEWRGVACEADQIVVTSGVAEGLEIAAQILLRVNDKVFIEDPAYPVVRNHLTKIGIGTIPIPIDEHGLNPEKIVNSKETGAAVLITPSRQFPLGMTMPLNRRLQLLGWADSNNAMIIEDDFDSEFRFEGQPLPALMSLSPTERVIYMGSFSKVMFPMLRLSYVVFPKFMETKVDDILGILDARASFMLQPVLASFMASGEFGSHVRRMRRIYSGRQRTIISAIGTHCKGLLSVQSHPSGMHIVTRLDPEVLSSISDEGVAEIAAKAGISVQPLSSFYVGDAPLQGLVFGFSGFDEDKIWSGIRALATALRKSLRYGI